MTKTLKTQHRRSNAEHQKAHRQRMKEQGYERLMVWLEPDAVRVLQDLLDKDLSPTLAKQKAVNEWLLKHPKRKPKTLADITAAFA